LEDVHDDWNILYVQLRKRRCSQYSWFGTLQMKVSFGSLRMTVSVKADSEIKEAAKRREACNKNTNPLDINK
jgi:hypothetical protein